MATWKWAFLANVRGSQGIQGPPGDASSWKPNTPYLANQTVISPNGDVVSAKVAFTSGATYDAANWNIVNKPLTVPNGTDWNNVVDMRQYRVDSFTNSATMANLPPVPGGFAGPIDVLPVAPGRVAQIAIEYATPNAGRMWSRMQNVNGSFTTWETMASQSSLIVVGQDLNTLPQGRHRTETSTIATSTLNNPGVINPFEVEVKKVSVANGVTMQVLTEWSTAGPIVSRRTSLSNVFQAWITEVPVVGSRVAFDAKGDSLTFGGGQGETWLTSEAWPARMATLFPGITVTNNGRSGDTTDEVMVRAGIHQLYFTVTGGSIPASGAVGVVTKFNAYIPRDRVYAGSLAGVPGTLAFTFSTNSWTFTRTSSGAAVPVAGSTLFVSGQNLTKTTPFSFFAGRNDIDFLVTGLEGDIAEHIIANHKKVYDSLPAGEKRVLFFGVTLRATETQGTAGYDRVWAINARMKQLFPGNYYCLMDYLIDRAFTDAGVTPTAADQAAIAKREAPPSLFIAGDTTHFQKWVADVIGRFFVARLLTAKGYVN
ncbi:hypothetical protein IRJ34_07285 [Paenarthrobacter sp. GOM3]|uniref:pyocin knob domain-containing protein n=1 Tax=Paenarthrobacter sp. GOM3 TaxID=2782567 RepID=UPI001BADF761|nr:pyocin knob domain-containing protein [Paenarthrobacter sp. GOM3]WOH20119.1 hypothetical protein IRJ34_07285 [Paenarthrobacter sp. GOM3]